jgi:hypothetical protein
VATDTEIIKAIERLQRAQPRNEDLLLVCEELQARLTASRSVGQVGQSRPRASAATAVDRDPGHSTNMTVAKQKVDRKTYQRELMRKRRAEGKA